ncbi:MAG: hypothetical protein H7Z72_15100 [Bacteroidetes bacterium]|nr:hypothetical protein [Fibrella sp.]
MESTNEGAGRQSDDDEMGGSRSDMPEPNVDMPDNDDEMTSVIYADLGIDGQPDSMNPGSDEATDTLLYTDNSTARNATNNLPNDEGMNDLPGDLLITDLSDEELDREIGDLTTDEEAGGEPY